jgi:hypothetical protein
MIDWRDRISIIGAVLISVIVVVGFAIVCGSLFFLKIPQEMKEIAMLLLGILGAGFTTVINYWTGSSSSSQKKDQTIAEAASTAAATAANVATAAAAKLP